MDCTWGTWREGKIAAFDCTPDGTTLCQGPGKRLLFLSYLIMGPFHRRIGTLSVKFAHLSFLGRSLPQVAWWGRTSASPDKLFLAPEVEEHRSVSLENPCAKDCRALWNTRKSRWDELIIAILLYYPRSPRVNSLLSEGRGQEARYLG